MCGRMKKKRGEEGSVTVNVTFQDVFVFLSCFDQIHQRSYWTLKPDLL